MERRKEPSGCLGFERTLTVLAGGSYNLAAFKQDVYPSASSILTAVGHSVGGRHPTRCKKTEMFEPEFVSNRIKFQ